MARALVTQPTLLLADEPTGNLDSERSREIMTLLVDLQRQHGITVVMVTHEPEMAAYASRVVRFRDGLIAGDELQVGTLGSGARVDRGGDRGVDREGVSQGVSEGGA